MDRNKKKLFWLVFAGLFSIMFLTLLTISFYGYVLEKIGVDHAENIRSYDTVSYTHLDVYKRQVRQCQL